MRALSPSTALAEILTMTGAVTARMMKERGRSGKTEAEEIEELMSLGINHPARRAHRERETRRVNEMKERMWNDTIFRTRPPNLIGLRCATKEPWHIDEVFYQKKTGNFEAGLTREKYDDRSVLCVYTARSPCARPATRAGLTRPTVVIRLLFAAPPPRATPRRSPLPASLAPSPLGTHRRCERRPMRSRGSSR